MSIFIKRFISTTKHFPKYTTYSPQYPNTGPKTRPQPHEIAESEEEETTKTTSYKATRGNGKSIYDCERELWCVEPGEICCKNDHFSVIFYGT